MALGSNYEIDGLRFATGEPHLLAGRFPEIQDLRQLHYERVFVPHGRTVEQVSNFVGRLTVESWADPNCGVGATARADQERRFPRVTVAVDDTSGQIEGFVYTAQNASSKAGAILRKLHVPEGLVHGVSQLEIDKKFGEMRQYVWSSEFVHKGERDGLPTMLEFHALAKRNHKLRPTWFPWREEDELREHLVAWGYKPVGKDQVRVSGKTNFGRGAHDTTQEYWRAPSNQQVIDNIHNLEGATAAISRSFSATGPLEP